MITKSDVSPIKIQSNTPNIIGLIPTVFTASIDKQEPIKKSVIVSDFLATNTTAVDISAGIDR